MNATTNLVDPVAQAKARLKQIFFPRWSIVYSDVGRWWGFRDPSLRKTDPLSQLTVVDAETAEGLHDKLAAAERLPEEPAVVPS